MPETKVITFGSAMVDTIAVLESDSVEQISFSNAHQQFLLVEPGRKVEAESIATDIGGGGLNTAVCLSRLGNSVAPMVKTGNDPSRDHILDHCQQNGIETSGILIDREHSSGSSVMIASHEKNAAIFTHRGANTCLNAADLEQITDADVDLIHAAPLSGESALMLPKIGALASTAGAFFSSNPGIRQITMRTNSVLAAARHMSLISMNEVEAAALVPSLSVLTPGLDWGCPNSTEPCLKSQGGKVGLMKFCKMLHQQGPENILVTFGGDGAWLFDGDKLYHQPIVPAHVASTAGAGDAFVSTLAWGMQRKMRPTEALLLAAHNASSVVSHVNTTDGLLTRDELFRRAGL